MSIGQTRFKVGHIPHNKGTSASWVCLNCKITFFRHGRKRQAKFCSRKCWSNFTRAENHPAWVGDSIGYSGIHDWIENVKGKPNKCQECGVVTAKRFEWANISGKYKRELTDWKRLCSKCHHALDRIAERGWATRKALI